MYVPSLVASPSLVTSNILKTLNISNNSIINSNNISNSIHNIQSNSAYNKLIKIVFKINSNLNRQKWRIALMPVVYKNVDL